MWQVSIAYISVFPLPFSHIILTSISWCLLCYTLFSIMEGLMLMEMLSTVYQQIIRMKWERIIIKCQKRGQVKAFHSSDVTDITFLWKKNKKTQIIFLHNIHWFQCYHNFFFNKKQINTLK